MVTIKELKNLIDFGLATIGQCIGGSPRKFSVSNTVGDVISINKAFLICEYNIEQLIKEGKMTIGKTKELRIAEIFSN